MMDFLVGIARAALGFACGERPFISGCRTAPLSQKIGKVVGPFLSIGLSLFQPKGNWTSDRFFLLNGHVRFEGRFAAKIARVNGPIFWEPHFFSIFAPKPHCPRPECIVDRHRQQGAR